MLLIGPTLFIVFALLLFPLGSSLAVSLHRVDPFSRQSTFIGLENYSAAISDPLFGLSLLNTFYFAALSIGGITAVGLVTALILNEPSRLQGLARTALIIPWSISQAVAGITWGWIYSGTFGALNGLLMQVGLIEDYRNWFLGGLSGFNLIGVAFVWSISPYATLVFLASLQSIPDELYQAAKIDGADIRARFRYVTLPSLRSSLLVVLVIATLDGFLAFTMIYVLTGGGPGNATTVLSWWGYSTSFEFNDIGKGAAILYMLSAMVMAASAVYVRYLHHPTGES